MKCPNKSETHEKNPETSTWILRKLNWSTYETVSCDLKFFFCLLTKANRHASDMQQDDNGCVKISLSCMAVEEQSSVGWWTWHRIFNADYVLTRIIFYIVTSRKIQITFQPFWFQYHKSESTKNNKKKVFCWAVGKKSAGKDSEKCDNRPTTTANLNLYWHNVKIEVFFVFIYCVYQFQWN